MTIGEPGPSRRVAAWAWAQLLRPPNLPTVPGDPLVGVALAFSAGFRPTLATTLWPVPQNLPLRAALAAMVALLIYATGLLLNDLFDLPEDSRDRPSRPLPAGAILPRAAWRLCMLLSLSAVLVAAVLGVLPLAATLALLSTVTLYNRWLKHSIHTGPATMSLCRGGSVLLGAVTCGWTGQATPALLLAAVGVSLYIFGISLIAHGEANPKPVGLLAWLPGLVVIPLAMLAGSWAFAAEGAYAFRPWIAVYFGLWLSARTMALGWQLRRPGSKPATPQIVGAMIRGQVILQALLLAGFAPFGGWLAMVLCFTLLGLSILLARWFYGS